MAHTDLASSGSAYTLDLDREADTIELGKRLARLLEPRDLVVLSGPLGSGKTFLVRAICRALGLPESERVTSPTFTLVHEYETTPPVSHADMYRLGGEPDVHELGLGAQRDEGHVLLVEWGEPYIRAFGGDALVVSLSLDPRRARVWADGPRASEVLARLKQC